ncbi:MAG: zinc-binding dehydrogenase [Phycisphaera sp.]|nr:zinc-binding dehydrogenase [Phycisphaera sp.]
MHQVIQNIRSGELSVRQTPDPVALRGEVLIANAASVISAGTEKAAIELARKSLIGKAVDRPDHVRRVLQKLRSDGLGATVRAVRARLDEPMTMGYASAGVVLEVGPGVQAYKPGDRVASNGAHAGVVAVPENLCARVPNGVVLEHAAFATLGAIAMHGVRLSRAVLGETVFVVGLGLVGQLTVAMLHAAGCRVVATDLDATRCDLARHMGADAADTSVDAARVTQLTNGLGADAVIITASTRDSQPIDLAVEAVRKKGRVVLVGVADIAFDRRALYHKEAEFVVSCSYGPGRYDAEYEQRGHDYPAAYVRWTEQRNMQAVIDMMAGGRLDVAPLITHRFAIEHAEEAYALIERGGEPTLGVVLTYPSVTADTLRRRVELNAAPTNAKVRIGVIGAGAYARSVMLPALRAQQGVDLVTISSAHGANATQLGEQYGFRAVASDAHAVINDANVNTVMILTRHGQHAEQVVAAIRAGRHVFVEKPLCLTDAELDTIEQALIDTGAARPLLTVGFNRRFAPATDAIRAVFDGVSAPLTVSIRMNAGPIDPQHWTQDEVEGGGRIIGEACHAIDLATHLVGAPPVRVYAESVGGPNAPTVTDDQCFITLRHANGSVSNIAYLAGGDRAFGKERVEVIGGGRVAVIDDFKSVTSCVDARTRTHKVATDKGHAACVAAFVEAVRTTGVAPIAWSDLRAVTLASIHAVTSLRSGEPVELT